ncbi:CMP-sialic acid transporter [Silurus asotus]|uniref:CMP-sialic acid transporter n=1 Tax=Silurus asotus TaxID=30991 RepID=A0AAD5B7N5_SILAS|nr:CMP-sialic acid transporter [Silurus asotus]
MVRGSEGNSYGVSLRKGVEYNNSASVLFKVYCLVVMTLVAAAYTVALRYTRTVQTDLYFSTTAVCLTEIIKLLLTLVLLIR